LKLRKPCPTRLTFLINTLIPSVGPFERPVVWNASTSASQARIVRARGRHSRTPVWSQCFVEEAKPPTRGADRARVVDVAQEFLGEVGVGDVTVAVTVTQHHEQPVVLLVAEPFVTDEEPAADPIQRIVASAPVTERLLLHATASVVDRLVRQPDRVEVINDDRRVESVRSGRSHTRGTGR
jgi:hypothetical protein